MKSKLIARIGIAATIMAASTAAFADQPTAAECAQAAIAADGLIEMALKNGMSADEADAAGIRLFTKVARDDYGVPTRDDILEAEEWCRRALAGPISAAFANAGAIAIAGAPSPSAVGSPSGAAGAAVTGVEGAASSAAE